MTLLQKYVSYRGPALDDPEILERLPIDLRQLLADTNGFILFDGGLHIRGASREPDWHSLRKLWEGDMALSKLYPTVRADDVPFGEDCLGDQFLLRDGSVHRLSTETGEVTDMKIELEAFLDEAQKKPIRFLGLEPLIQFQRENGHYIKPGELLDVYPLFCMKESANGVSLKAAPALQRISFLAHIAAQIANLPDGAQIQIKFVD